MYSNLPFVSRLILTFFFFMLSKSMSGGILEDYSNLSSSIARCVVIENMLYFTALLSINDMEGKSKTLAEELAQQNNPKLLNDFFHVLVISDERRAKLLDSHKEVTQQSMPQLMISKLECVPIKVILNLE